MEEHHFDVENLKSKVSIVDLIGGFIPLKKMGKDWFGKCPFHADADPSFSVSEAKAFFFCHGCRAGGDAIDFWMQFHHVDFPAAVLALAARYGIQVDEHTIPQVPRHPHLPKAEAGFCPAERPAPAEIWAEKATRFVQWCYEQLYEAPEALAYLHGRGLTDKTISAFGLGWNPGKDGRGLFRPRPSWGLLPERDEESGKERKLWLPVGWVVPSLVKGRVHRIRIRQPDNREFGPKYFLVLGSSMATLCLEQRARSGERRAASNHRPVYVLVESELDAILLHQEAGDVAGAVGLGSANTRPDAATTTKLREAVCILNALDFDRAGAEARAWWKAEFPRCRRWPVPKGKDPGEAWKAGVDLRAWVMEGLPEGMRG